MKHIGAGRWVLTTRIGYPKGKSKLSRGRANFQGQQTCARQCFHPLKPPPTRLCSPNQSSPQRLFAMTILSTWQHAERTVRGHPVTRLGIGVLGERFHVGLGIPRQFRDLLRSPLSTGFQYIGHKRSAACGRSSVSTKIRKRNDQRTTAKESGRGEVHAAVVLTRAAWPRKQKRAKSSDAERQARIHRRRLEKRKRPACNLTRHGTKLGK